ncbi:MAG: hypothetical protein ACLFVU_03135, partial [Phycisphaerae bacterium]
MIQEMKRHDVPAEQFERMGLDCNGVAAGGASPRVGELAAVLPPQWLAGLPTRQRVPDVRRVL